MGIPSASPSGRSVVMLGAALAFLSVVAGAFGAHGAKPLLSSDLFGIYQTAVQYQFFHSIALLVVGIMAALPLRFNYRYLMISAAGFLVGILLFSGSLYLYAFTGVKKLGMITPFGGLCFLVGWLMLGLSAWSVGGDIERNSKW